MSPDELAGVIYAVADRQPDTDDGNETAAHLREAASYIETKALSRLGAQFAALRLVIRRCPTLAAQAATVMQEPDDDRRALQVDRLVPLALRLASRDMDDDERAVLAEAMEGRQGVTAS